MQLSVVIPTLNERETIAALVRRVAAEGVHETLVVDGASEDGTAEAAAAAGARVIASARGRGPQQNAGARASSGDTLLFLHADTALPAGFPRQIQQVLAAPGTAAGAFRFKLDADTRGMRLLERMVDWRCRRFQLPYGDQGIFVRRDVFERAGGFPDAPLLEDYELIRRLRKLGRVAIAEGEAVTSARRWRKLGLWRATWSNNVCLLAYWLNVPTATISRWRGAGL
jgi:rSAM/selenodomain-associated transferase 2